MNDVTSTPPAPGGETQPVVLGAPREGLDARVLKLENSLQLLERNVHTLLENREMRGDVRDIRERLTALETTVSRIEKQASWSSETVVDLPGKGFLIALLLLGLIGVAALLAFQTQLQRFAAQSLPMLALEAPATAPQAPAAARPPQ